MESKDILIMNYQMPVLWPSSTVRDCSQVSYLLTNIDIRVSGGRNRLFGLVRLYLGDDAEGARTAAADDRSATTTAAVVNCEVAMWSGCLYAPSAPKVSTTSGHRAQMPGDVRRGLARVGGIKHLVRIVEHCHLAHTQRGRGGAHLEFAQLRERHRGPGAPACQCGDRGSAPYRRVSR